MTRELIIEGQHVDLSPDTDITLEFVSNILGDIGKISLSRSYTAKLPKTLRNARIFDDPGRPGHDSTMTRRFLSARYYRNGIDLIGDAQAYVLRVTSDSYEVALVWNTLPALQELSQSKKTINDLQDLGVLTWIGSNGQTPDYMGMQPDSNGALFAWYESGLGALKYPDVNAATHPSMSLNDLLRMIMEQAGVPYSVRSERAQSALWSTMLLAAPNHKPNRAMELASGSVAGTVLFEAVTANNTPDTMLILRGWTNGWDAPTEATGATNTFNTGETKKHRLLVNLRTSEDFSNAYISVHGAEIESSIIQDQEELGRFYFMADADGWYCFVDETIDLGNWGQYLVQLGGIVTEQTVTPTAYQEGSPLFAAYREHDIITIEKDNRFPMEGNLPDIGQWELVKACMSLFGMVPVIRGGAVEFYDYGQIFDKADAMDWTSKVAMTEDGAPEETTPSADSWARSNDIVFAENEDADDPTASILVSDATLAESREWAKVPFAASRFSSAIHYKVGNDNEVEDVNIEPRIMTLVAGTDANGDARTSLHFTDNLAGEALVGAYYSELQEVMVKPVRIAVNVRLHELDLAQLELRRPVYLGQYGQYYSIIKIQTSDSDLCKVELIQIP